MLGSRGRLGSAVDLLSRKLVASSAARKPCSVISPELRSLVGCVQDRSYSNTKSLMRRKSDIPKELRDVLDKQPEIQTINAPEGITEAEIYKLMEEEKERLREMEAARWNPNYKPGMGMRKRPLTVSYKLEDFEYELDPSKPPKWTLRDRRCGLLGIKLGMMPWWDVWGLRYPVTVLYVEQNVVMDHRTEAKDGYIAVKVAAGQRKRKNVSRVDLGQYRDLMENVEYEDNQPPYLCREFRITDEKWLIPKYTRLHARHFVPGQNVDVSGISKGKGFQGGMKRHNFKGMPASHGTSLSHRAIGSTGQCSQPGRVFKGKKMPGRMGAERVTVQNLRVLKIDRGRNLLYLKGGVPGNKGEWVEIRDAVKKPLWRTDLVLPREDGELHDRPPLPTFEFDETIDGCGEPGFEFIMPQSQVDLLSNEPDVA